MRTKPKTDAPKSKNLTINVTEKARNEIDTLRNKHFAGLPLNLFTACLLEIGVKTEQLRFRAEAIRNEALLKQAAGVTDNAENLQGGKSA